MDEYLQRYLPEFDENDIRTRLTGFGVAELTDMLIRAYKEKRVFAKMLEESDAKLKEVQEVLNRPSALTNMPGIPSADDLRRMTGDE